MTEPDESGVSEDGGCGCRHHGVKPGQICAACRTVVAPLPGPTLGRDLLPESNFRRVALEVAALVEEKNAAYGDSFAQAGKFLRLLWPEGVPPESYDDMLTVVRIFDKLKRVATGPTAFGEDPRRDVLGYAILWAAQAQEGR